MTKKIINRLLKLSHEDSLFLFGPRGTGKSTLLKQLFRPEECLWIDFLSPKQEDLYSRHPDELTAKVEGMTASKTHIVIDEIQKVPKLLDVVHSLIESTDKHFILTGSSARKIKKNAANLLAGRAFVYNLAALTFQEIGEAFELPIALAWGTLPKIYHCQSNEQRKKFLQSYAYTYLKEEVWAEQFIRDLDPFRYFLEVAAQCNGKILNFSKIGRDVGVDYKTIENYYSILEDTLLGFFLPAYSNSFRKQLSHAPKFYFFDTGVTRALGRMLSIPVKEATSYYGEVFEHFIIAEIKKYIGYYAEEYRLSFLRTKGDLEIDLIVQRPGQRLLLIEIKSTDNVLAEQLTRLASLAKDIPNSEAIVLSRDSHRKVYGDITVWPWQEGILHYFCLAE